MVRRTLTWPLCWALALASCDDSGGASPAEMPGDQGALDAAPLELDAAPLELDAAPVEPDATPAELDAAPAEPDATPAELDAAPAEPDAEPDAAPLELPWSCEGGAAFLYEPFGEVIGAFPDDVFTQPDPQALTGLKVDLEAAPWLRSLPGDFNEVFLDMGTLDGFGTSGGVHLRFSAGLAPISEEIEAIQLVELGADGAIKALAYEPIQFDEGRGLALWPIRPLEPATRHGVIILSDVPLRDGGCLEPGPQMGAILTGQARDPRLAAMTPRYEALLEAAGLAPEAVGAALVFTTQSVHETSMAIAADIASRSYAWAETPSCTPDGRYLHCEGRFEAFDYRDADGVVRGAEPVSSYALPVSLWFTHVDPQRPPPTIIVGHGIQQDRSLCGYIAGTTDAESVSFIGIDAILHGEHPAGVSSSAATLLLDFFAVDIAHQTVDAQRLRDNFRQSTFDRLQLLRLLLENPDVTGDGVPDLDVSRVGYFGVSFGGIMGSEYLALSDATSMAYLGMPGGRLSEFVRSVPAGFEALLDMVFGVNTPPATRDLILAGLQTVVERGDPINFAPRVMTRRLPIATGAPPHVLAVMAMEDQIVPNQATISLMRALRLPQAEPKVRAIPYLALEQTPLMGNVAAGKLTGGLFQYDHVRRYGRIEDADHVNVLKGDETRHQFLHYYLTWLADGLPEIIDPYPALDLEGP
ncbi:hypothetical protein KKF91_01740 [Myxococcota bacterium]|nr:hypothetical protein [Myxococcota bacterium]